MGFLWSLCLVLFPSILALVGSTLGLLSVLMYHLCGTRAAISNIESRSKYLDPPKREVHRHGGPVEAYRSRKIQMLTVSMRFSNDKSCSNSCAFIHQLNPYIVSTNDKPVGFRPLLRVRDRGLDILLMLKVI